MAKILILGGTGAIGQYFVKELAETDHSIFVTSRKKRDNFKNIHYVLGNAKDKQFLNSQLQDSYDCIVDFMHWGTEEFNNIHANLLNKTGHYIFLSSYRVYANADLQPLTETSPLLLDTSKDAQYLKTDEYALSKARCERLLQNSDNKNFTILRPSITFSTNRFQIGTLEADVILPRAFNGKPLLLAEEMLDKRAAIGWAATAGKMIASLILMDDAKGEIFNIGTRESHTWKTIAAYYHELLGVDYIYLNLQDYLKLGFSPYQIKYDRLFNRILNNHKILAFLTKHSYSLEIPNLYTSLKYEINLNKNLKPHLKENLKISGNMDAFIAANKTKINLAYGDHFQLLEIINNVNHAPSDIKIILQYINEYIAKKEYDNALKECATLQEYFPYETAGYIKAYEIFRKINEPEKAEHVLEQGMKLIPKDNNLWIASYDLAMAKKDYTFAMKRAQEMIQKFPNLCSGYFRAAKVYSEMGEYDKADESAKRGIELAPKADITWLTYAEIAMRKGNYKKALERWSKFREIFPKRKEGYIQAANASFRSGNLDAALEYCQECRKALPDCIDPLIISYDFVMQKRDFQRALQISLNMQENFPNVCSGYFRAAKVYSEMGEYDKAEESAKRGIELAPKADITWLTYAEIAMRKGDYKEALERWAKFRELFPNCHEGYTRAAIAYFRLDNLDNALKYCQECISVLPDCIDPLITTYDFMMQKRDFPQALQICQNMQEKFSNFCSGYFRAAKVYSEMGEYDKADESARRGIELAPKADITWLTYAEIAMRKGDYKEALERWAKFREIFPNRHEGYTRAAIAYFRLDNLDNALKYCQECISVLPDCMDPLITTYDFMMQKRDFPQALQISLNMQEKFPNMCSGYFRAANVYMVMDEYKKAEDMAYRAIELAPDAAVVWLVYADVPMRQGNFELALERFATIREKFPKEIAAYARAAQACRKLGDFQQAREICEKGMQIDDNTFEHLTYTIADIMAQAPEDYFKSIDYFNILYEKLPEVRNSNKFYEKLHYCLFYLFDKFNQKDGNEYLDKVLKIFLSDDKGQNSATWFFTFLKKYKISNTECKRKINDIIDKYKIFSDFTLLLHDKTTYEQKKTAFCNLLHLKNQICLIQILSINDDRQIYNKIIEEIFNDKELFHTFSDYGLYILLQLCELLNIKRKKELDEVILNIKNKNTPIYRFFQYRKQQYDLIKNLKPVKSFNKHLKIAVCVSGQLRGFDKVKENWENIFNLNEYDCTYFVHVWKNIGRKLPYLYEFYPRSFKGNFLKAYQKINPNLNFIQHYYKNFYKLLEGDNDIHYNKLKEYYSTNHIKIDDEKDKNFLNFNHMQKMFYKIYACNELIHQPMQHFDLVIRIRPDVSFNTNKILNLNEIYENCLKNNVIYTIAKFAPPWTNELLITDTLAISTQPIMDVYSRTYLDHFNFINMNLFQHKAHLIPHVSLGYQLFSHGISINELHTYEKFNDPDPLNINDIYESLQKDIANHPQKTYEDEILLKACEEDLANLAN